MDDQEDQDAAQGGVSADEGEDIATQDTGDEQPEREQDDHPELVNLAIALAETDAGRNKLAEIGNTVFANFMADDMSRAEWLKQHEKYIKLAAQADKPKSPPWQDSSAESLPILAEACGQFTARALRAFFPSEDIIRAVPIGHVSEADLDRADRVGKHMSWQLMIQDRQYYRNKDRLLTSLPLHGSFFTKCYRDPIRKRNVVENVRAVDLVVPYGIGARDIEEVMRKTHIIWMDVHRSIFLANNQYFLEAASPFEDEETSGMQDAINKVSGQQPSEEADHSSKQAKLLEQHCFWDLDDDGVMEPYIITVDAQTQHVLRIAIRWAAYDEDVVVSSQDFQGNPIVDPTTGQPQTHVAAKKGSPINFREPIEYFTHYAFIENPDGFYGLGMGYLVGTANDAVNKLLRQIIDAGTLANMRTGFVSKNLGLKKGPLEIEFGKLISVDAMTDDIKKSIFMLEYPGPNEGLVKTMELLKQSADRLAGSTEVLTGSPSSVMQPHTVQALIEQGLAQYSAVQNRVHNSFEQELAKLYRLNSLYLDDVEYFAVNDISGPKEVAVAKDDYVNDLQVRPSVDPSHATDQSRITKAETEYKLLMTNPAVQGNPILTYNVTVRYLKALGSNDIDQVLPRPSDDAQAPTPPEIQRMQMEAKKAADSLQSQERIKLAELNTQLEIARINAEVAIESAKMKAGIAVDPYPGTGQVGQIGYPPMGQPTGNQMVPPTNAGPIQPPSPNPLNGAGPTGGPSAGNLGSNALPPGPPLANG